MTIAFKRSEPYAIPDCRVVMRKMKRYCIGGVMNLNKIVSAGGKIFLTKHSTIYRWIKMNLGKELQFMRSFYGF